MTVKDDWVNGNTVAAVDLNAVATEINTAVMHLAGTETVTGAKNFTGGLNKSGNAVVETTDARLSDTRTPTDATVTTAKFTAATLVTAADTLASSDNDTSVPTTAAVIDAIAAGGGGGGTVDTVVAGTNIDVDATDPANPIVSVEALTAADITGTTAEFNTANSDANFYTTGGTDVAVADGGTGVSTLTGIAKGNGTSAFTAAAAGTDYVAPGGALGTPSSGTLTSCTGLPLSGVVDSTTEPLGAGSIELGHATDTTMSRVSAGVVDIEGFVITTKSVVSLTSTATLAAVAGREYTYLLGTSAVPTLPTAVSNTSVYNVKNTTAAAISLATTSSQTIDAMPGPLLIHPQDCYTLMSDTANWVIT